MHNYPLNQVEHFANMKIFIDRIAEKYGDIPAISTYNAAGECSTRTYCELVKNIHSLAEELADRGLAGKHIAIISENCYMSVVALLAITYIGSVAVPLDIEQPADIMKAMVSFADVQLVFISEDMIEGVCENGMFDGRPVIIISDDRELPGGFLEAVALGEDLIGRQGQRCSGSDIDPLKTAVIVYTSGTTNTSKPVMLSHDAILLNAVGSTELVDFPLRMFTSLPLYHVYGMVCALLNNLSNGAEICINGDIRFMLRDFTLFKPTGIMVVPLIAEVLCKKLVSIANEECGGDAAESKTKLIGIKERVFPGLKVVISGGAHLPKSVFETLHKFGILVLEGYGITECAPLISVNRNRFYKGQTVGMVLPSYEVKIKDGEILVRGRCLMTGYYKQETLTEEAFDEGWFKTGDLGSLDSEGFLTITGRKKNLIVLKNGKNVSPEELENFLAQIPMIKEAMVYGAAVGNGADDVIPAVTIYPNPDETRGMTTFEILSELQRDVDAINEKLPSFKQIRLVNIREKEFPKTSTKKIKRQG